MGRFNPIRNHLHESLANSALTVVEHFVVVPARVDEVVRRKRVNRRILGDGSAAVADSIVRRR